MKLTCSIKENSFIARMAAYKLGASGAAIVVGRTIHLHNASKHNLMKNTRWLRHEVAHVKQFHRYGYLQFIAMYLWESLKNGYYNNKYEAEARASELDETICEDVVIK